MFNKNFDIIEMFPVNDPFGSSWMWVRFDCRYDVGGNNFLHDLFKLV